MNKEKTKSLFDELGYDNNNPYSDNPPQVFINGKGSNEKVEESVQMSGAFFVKGEELIADIRLEFNAKHPLFGLYIKRLKEFVKECEEVHVLKSSSGI